MPVKNIAKRIVRKYPKIRRSIKSAEFFKDIILIFLNQLVQKNIEEVTGNKIYLFGWYGTETAGDKLILLGLLYKIYQQTEANQIPVLLCSLNPEVSRETEKELIVLLSCYKQDNQGFIAWLKQQVTIHPISHVYTANKGDICIQAGGPIMDDPEIYRWFLMARNAKRSGAKFYIIGSGTGPLTKKITQYLYRQLVKRADFVLTRNEIDILHQNSFSSLDPAFLTGPLLAPLAQGVNKVASNKTLALNVRSIPFQYASDSVNVDETVKQNIGVKVADFVSKYDIEEIAIFTTHELDAYSDLDITRDILKSLDLPNISIRETDSDLCSLIELLANSDYVISTRYHGLILGAILGSKSMGLDYNKGGGKTRFLYESLDRSRPLSTVFNQEKISSEDFIDTNEVNISQKIKKLLEPYNSLQIRL